MKNPINLTVTRIIALNKDGSSAEVKLGDCFKLLSGSRPAIAPEKNVQDPTFDNNSQFSVREFIVTDMKTKEEIELTSYYKNDNGPNSRFFMSTEQAKKYLVTVNNLPESKYRIADFQPTDEQKEYLQSKYEGKIPGYTQQN